MFKAAAFLATALVAAPVSANYMHDADRLVLIRAAKGTGITFLADSALCADEPRLLGAFIPDKGYLHMCFENIKAHGTNPDITLKHELIHAAQTCKGGALDPTTNYLKDVKDLPVEMYPIDQLQTEAEARALAPIFSFNDVARVLVTQCH